MTNKEYTAIREFYGKHENIQMIGHVWFFPKAIKHIKRPSPSVELWAKRNHSLYFQPKKMRVDGDFIRILDIYNGVFHVHRKWIKCIMLKHYNN